MSSVTVKLPLAFVQRVSENPVIEVSAAAAPARSRSRSKSRSGSQPKRSKSRSRTRSRSAQPKRSSRSRSRSRSRSKQPSSRPTSHKLFTVPKSMDFSKNQYFLIMDKHLGVHNTIHLAIAKKISEKDKGGDRVVTLAATDGKHVFGEYHLNYYDMVKRNLREWQYIRSEANNANKWGNAKEINEKTYDQILSTDFGSPESYGSVAERKLYDSVKGIWSKSQSKTRSRSRSRSRSRARSGSARPKRSRSRSRSRARSGSAQPKRSRSGSRKSRSASRSRSRSRSRSGSRSYSQAISQYQSQKVVAPLLPPPKPPNRGHDFKTRIPRRGPLKGQMEHGFDDDIQLIIDTLAGLTNTIAVPYSNDDSEYIIRPAFRAYLIRAVRKLDKETLLQEFGNVSDSVTGKLLKGIAKRPSAPDMFFELIDASPYLSAEAKAFHKEQHRLVFEWENKYTVWYLRKRLYAAIIHALIQSFLYVRQDRSEYEAETKFGRIRDTLSDEEWESMMSELQLDNAIPIDGYPKILHDPKYMQDWKQWAPPVYKWDKDWFKYLTQPVPRIDDESRTKYEVSREVPKGYEQFV